MVVVCRYGEIFLKGRNKQRFEQILVHNIRYMLRRAGVKGEVKILQNRIIIDTMEHCKFVQNVFGLVSLSPTVKVPLEYAEIARVAAELMNKRSFNSFRVAAQRLTKSSKFSSVEVNNTVGAMLLDKFNTTVDLKNPEVIVGVEIINDDAYVFVDSYKGLGGLPVGVSGKVLVLMNDIFSELAALLLMKRGCEVIGAQMCNYRIRLLSDNLIGYQNESIQSVDELYKLAVQHEAQALVTGSIDGRNELILNTDLGIPILNPLVGMSESDARERLREYENFC